MENRIDKHYIGEMFLPVPTHEGHIATETAKPEALRAATERTIALLKERRAALIGQRLPGQA